MKAASCFASSHFYSIMFWIVLSAGMKVLHREINWLYQGYVALQNQLIWFSGLFLSDMLPDYTIIKCFILFYCSWFCCTVTGIVGNVLKFHKKDEQRKKKASFSFCKMSVFFWIVGTRCEIDLSFDIKNAEVCLTTRWHTYAFYRKITDFKLLSITANSKNAVCFPYDNITFKHFK